MKKNILFVAAAGLAVGTLLGRGCAGRKVDSESLETNSLRPAIPAKVWTCSMHPQIRQPKPGQCPLCGMDLIPVAPQSTSVDAESLRQIEMSPSARKLAEIATAPVERRAVSVEIRLLGKIQFDETRLAYIAARIPGRIDRLYVNYNGAPVKAGDALADLFSPDLVTAQQELLQVKAVGGAAATTMADATRGRLRRWGLTPEQISEVERGGEARERITFRSPIGGIVVEKAVREGQYVETGQLLFTVADLSRVWAVLDVYESDLPWLRYAQEVSLYVEAYPGETFRGRIAFIDPTLDPASRTVKARVTVDNSNGRLKPEMFAHAVVHAVLAADNQALWSDPQGPWICPVHPEIVAREARRCSLCDTALVHVSALGYVTADELSAPWPLVIPASAPLITGKRAIVYVARRDQEGVYEGREILLGARAGDYYLVREGLQEGELVVVNGNFKIDSSLQIQGKLSMMMSGAGLLPKGDPQLEAPSAATPESHDPSLSGMAAPPECHTP
jgi:Cu(I)/Ag(I) efflux system membrane fusion protein